MKVLILGAGASKSAKYPLSNEIMGAIEARARAKPDYRELSSFWKDWDSFRQSVPLKLKRVVYSPNPEVILSFLDLLDLALEEADENERREVQVHPSNFPETRHDGFRKWTESRERKWLEGARHALSSFLYCLELFFLERHEKDASNRVWRSHHRKRFAELKRGDVVITLNWDTTAERTLREEGKWNPITGYGIRKDLNLADPYDPGRSDPIPEGFPDSSEVHVLKLHGSVGWYQLWNDRRIYFEYYDFLCKFGFEYPDPKSSRRSLQFLDPIQPLRHPRAYLSDRVIAYPSYLKRFRVPQMQEIWSQANSALNTADKVDIWGYSLPESDGAVRTLLLPLAERVNRPTKRGEVQICVHDPDRKTCKRWYEFFDGKAEMLKENF